MRAASSPPPDPAITDAVRQAAEHSDHVTPDRLDARIAWDTTSVTADDQGHSDVRHARHRSRTDRIRPQARAGQRAVIAAMRFFAE